MWPSTLTLTTTVTVLLSVLASAASTATGSGGENDLSFLVIADMHTMSNFLRNPSNIQLKNSLTTILQNIRDNHVGETDIVVSPGDVVSFGSLRGFEKLMDLTGISDENEAVYDAAMTCYNMTNEVYQEAGFTRLQHIYSLHR